MLEGQSAPHIATMLSLWQLWLRIEGPHWCKTWPYWLTADTGTFAESGGMMRLKLMGFLLDRSKTLSRKLSMSITSVLCSELDPHHGSVLILQAQWMWIWWTGYFQEKYNHLQRKRRWANYFCTKSHSTCHVMSFLSDDDVADGKDESKLSEARIWLGSSTRLLQLICTSQSART